MSCECKNKKGRGLAFAMSNRTDNSVSGFARDDNGALHFLDEDTTGGSGTGVAAIDPLGSQGALVTDKACRFLFAVNAGGNTVSSFRLEFDRLTLADVKPSGGVMPVSIAVFKNLLYVANVGSAAAQANVSGFFVDQRGTLHAIPGSTMVLGAGNPMPACAVFSPDGRFLMVSERGANLLRAFPVKRDGTLENPVTTPSNGAGPFGMTFSRDNVLLVAEAGPNALSSYRVLSNGMLSVISASVPNNQSATCWVSVTPDGEYAYTSNAATGTISLYRAAKNGSLTLMESVPSTPMMNGAPLDSAIDPDGEFFYVLNGAQGSISAFRIGCEGHLTLIQIYEYTSLPDVGAQGLAVC